MYLFFTGILTVLVFFGAQLKVPTAFAVPSFTRNSPTPLGTNSCAASGCHNGTPAPGGSATVTGFPAGMTYTPGTPIPLTVTITDSAQNRFGFELTARLVSNTATAAGTWAAGTGSNTGTNVVPVIQGVASSPTFTFTWTPPATASGNVNFYLTGLAGGCCTDGLYTNMYTLMPGTAASPDFSLSASPTSLAVTQGASGSSTITITPSGGFSSAVSLSALGMPTGVTASFASNALTLAASGTATTGTSTVTITGKSGTLSHTTTVGLTVNAATVPPDFSLSASPTSLAVAQGASGSSTITVTPSNGFNSAVTFTAAGVPSGVTASFASNALTLAASGTATTGTSTVTVTGKSGTLSHTTTVGLTVSTAGSGTGTLTSTPTSLSFNYQMGGRLPSSRTLSITSTGGSTSYTAKETDPWLSINPTSGGTPGSIRASVNPAGMAAGSYGAQINITAQNGKTTTVTVALIITSSSGGGTSGTMFAQPYMSDSQSGTLAAAWVDNLGASPLSTTDARNRGLVLAKSASALATAWAGASIQNVTGMSLKELSFDFRASIPCSADSPHFVVVTTDGVKHMVGGCTSSPNAPPSSAPTGWTRLWFDLSQGTQAISSPIQSISLVLDKGTASTGSIAVIDNIEVNGVLVGKGATSTSRDD